MFTRDRTVKTAPWPFLRKCLLATAMAATVTGCAALDLKRQTTAQTAAARTGPSALPARSITGFSGALRCMDNLMIDYGVRDISMLVEDILDETKKINAGTRDMLITAISDMTRRSRAVRVVAFGKDAINAISFLSNAQRQSAYQTIPSYDIKGSVTQFDENVIRNQRDAAVSIAPYLSAGVAQDAASSILALDLSVLTTADMSVLPGVTSRNSVVILKDGKGLDGDAAYRKFGVNFSLTLSQSEGQSQALRGLVELAAVELLGKLTKTPYWQCLGAAEDNEEIKLEVSDWFYAMAATRVELIAYFQNQLRQRGYYDGPIDGAFNPAIDRAIESYRALLGLSRRALLDEEFFTAYLRADHAKLARPVPVATAPVTPTPAASPLGLKMLVVNQQRGAGKARLELLVQPTQEAHVYCYMQDEKRQILRFYPNRFARDSLVTISKGLTLPGAMPFKLVVNDQGITETIACFATRRDVLRQLPSAAVGVDFEQLPVTGLEQLRDAFVSASGGLFAEETLDVPSK